MAHASDLEVLINTVMRFRKLVFQTAAHSHEEHQATMLQMATLQILRDSGDGTVTVSDIARAIRLSKSSATQLIDRLVKAGFVSRREDTADRRVIRLSITGDGERHVRAMRAHVLKQMEVLFSDVSDRDVRELTRILTVVAETLNNKKNEHSPVCG